MTRFESRAWQRLLTSLASLDGVRTVRDVPPGRIRIVLTDGRKLEIVMTPAEWVDMASIMWGSVDDAVGYVRSAVDVAGPDTTFLVHHQHALEPSSSPTVPADPDLARLDELLEDNGGRAIGRWVAYRPRRDESDQS